MPVYSDAAELQGSHVSTIDGHRLGRIEEVYPDGRTREPEWAAVATGPFRTHVCLIPTAALDWDAVGSELTVALTRERIIGAPRHPAGTRMSASDQTELVTYYGHSALPRTG